MKMLSKRSLSVTAATLTLALLGPAVAAADTATSDLTVTANVVAKCTIGAATLSFGNYDPVSAHATADLDVTTDIPVTCSSGASYTVTLGMGGNGDRTMTQTTLPGGGAVTGTPGTLAYELYTDSGRTTIWGSDTTSGLVGTGSGSAQNIPVYGRVVGGLNVPVGGYSDTVVSTIHF